MPGVRGRGEGVTTWKEIPEPAAAGGQPTEQACPGCGTRLVWGAVRLRDVLAIRRRMRLGSHLPHPALEMQRGSTLRWQSSQGRRRVMIDGRNYGRADAVSVTVRPDAFTLVVTATQE